MSEAQVSTPSVSQLVEHLFRHEGGKMVATLTGIFGLEYLTLAEDVVQEALSRALQTWPFYGVPDNPAAWIMRASRNLALDVVRREKVFRHKEPEIVRLMEQQSPVADAGIVTEYEIGDDRLRLMFVCCHPSIPQDAQAALALKTLCGFSVTEIARAFLTNDAAIAKRLTRAKQKIREANVPFSIPVGPELAQRLEGVWQTLYLLFNEGYKASSGEKLVREDLCAEAIRLAHLLASHRSCSDPRTHALLALMLLNAARLPARLDREGNLLRLAEQDRRQWNSAMIARGMFHLAKSAGGDQLSRYHLEAGISACHCAAADYASTDWPKILALYDRLRDFDESPVIALNRAIVVAEVHGPETALSVIQSIQRARPLETYYLLYATLGELKSRLGRFDEAADDFNQACELAGMKSEKEFLTRRRAECLQHHPNRLQAQERVPV